MNVLYNTDDEQADKDGQRTIDYEMPTLWTSYLVVTLTPLWFYGLVKVIWQVSRRGLYMCVSSHEGSIWASE